jgi:antitoxin HigA-1
MPSRKLKPVHPGEVLWHDFMEPLGVSAYLLSKRTGISAQQYGRILKGTRGISGDVALRLGRFFGTSAELWMNLQARWELDKAEDAAGQEIRKRIEPFKAA